MLRRLESRMSAAVQNNQGLLFRLHSNHVEFVIIGGLCAVLHGISLVTEDLDICCRFSAENLRKLESAVSDLHPVHRLTANRLPLELTDHLCATLRNLYLRTDLGILDCLGEVKAVGGYDEVLAASVPVQFGFGIVRMLNIDRLIDAKEAVGRDRDIAAVRMLRAIKAENEKNN